jgi:hypothetical protein
VLTSDAIFSAIVHGFFVASNPCCVKCPELSEKSIFGNALKLGFLSGLSALHSAYQMIKALISPQYPGITGMLNGLLQAELPSRTSNEQKYYISFSCSIRETRRTQWGAAIPLSCI